MTLVGSSGAGPIDPAAPRERVRAALAPVLDGAERLELPFGRPERFPGTNIVVLPLPPHGALRVLHDRIAVALAEHGIPTGRARFTFTPHATLSFYRTLGPAEFRELLAVRAAGPAVVDRVEVSYTRSPQPADFFNPSGCGTRNEKIERSAAAFSGVVSHNVKAWPSILIFCDDP